MISQFKSKRALKEIRKMKLKRKKMNTIRAKIKYENSPKRSLLYAIDRRTIGQQMISKKILSPSNA